MATLIQNHNDVFHHKLEFSRKVLLKLINQIENK